MRIEDLLVEVPEHLLDTLLEELIATECEQRLAAGEQPQFSEYESRFRSRSDAALRGYLRFDPFATMPPVQNVERFEKRDTDDSRIVEACQMQVELKAGGAKEEDEIALKRIGRCEILRVLGEGGFGRVYLAWDTLLRREVALKVPNANFLKSDCSVELFLEEARTAASLDHSGLVRVYDVQEVYGRPYIIQQYIKGSNLNEMIKAEGASYEQIVKILIEIVGAVGFLHQQRRIHRDLKPTNILVDTEGHAHVADFGLAVHESNQWERAGEVAGTLRYMSPEQLRGETQLLDGRSDLWSIGVILYEMLVGDVPFRAKRVPELRAQILSARPRPLRQIVPQVPLELERICLKCLQHLTDRYGSAADLAQDLQHFLSKVECSDGHHQAILVRSNKLQASYIVVVIVLLSSLWLVYSRVPMNSALTPSMQPMIGILGAGQIVPGELQNAIPIQVGTKIRVSAVVPAQLEWFVIWVDGTREISIFSKEDPSMPVDVQPVGDRSDERLYWPSFKEATVAGNGGTEMVLLVGIAHSNSTTESILRQSIRSEISDESSWPRLPADVFIRCNRNDVQPIYAVGSSRAPEDARVTSRIQIETTIQRIRQALRDKCEFLLGEAFCVTSI